MSAGVLDEVKVRAEATRPAFEPTRAERLRIWATCLTLAAAVQLAVVCALAPNAPPRYVVQFEAIERRPMFVASRFTPGAINRAATERAATERAGAEGESAINRAATERAATERAGAERAGAEGESAINRAATERAGAINRAATERAATARRPRSVDARFIAQEGTNAATRGDPVPDTEGTSMGEAASGTGEAEAAPPGDGDSPAPSPHTAPTLTSETTPGSWADAVGTQVSRGMRYPRAAEEDGVEGVAMLRIHVEVDGRIVSVALVRSSGDERLDEAALTRARALERLPPPPHGTRAIDIPVRFRLP